MIRLGYCVLMACGSLVGSWLGSKVTGMSAAWGQHVGLALLVALSMGAGMVTENLHRRWFAPRAGRQ